jgi:phospholipase C
MSLVIWIMKGKNIGKKMKKIAIILLFLSLVLSACGTSNSLSLKNTTPPPSNPNIVTSKTVTQPRAVTQQPNQPSATLTAVPTSPSPAQAAAGIPNFDHIVLIVLENRDYQTALDNMPHLKDLAEKNVLLSNYFAASHPSLPNYIALVSGSTQNITSDCTNCFVSQPNLADEMEKSGRTWKAYLESMPSPCFLGDANPYAQKHNPFLYFDSVRLNANRCNQSIVPLTQLDSDLSANQLPNFSFIMPNLCDSGHDCKPSKADKWVNEMVKKLQDSPSLGKNSLIIITFDEASGRNTTSCCGLGKGGGKVVTILISSKAKSRFVDDTAYSHYSLLKTILTAWNLPHLGKTDESTIQPIVLPWADTTSNP